MEMAVYKAKTKALLLRLPWSLVHGQRLGDMAFTLWPYRNGKTLLHCFHSTANSS